MNVLVLNGSPKSQRSNTMKITSAFLEGLNWEQNHDIDIIDISKAKIDHCLGCYSCWSQSPGECVIKDDMADLIKKYVAAELIVWSFPLYYFGMPSKIKAFLDRLLPTNLPTMHSYEDGTSGHPSRYDLSNQRHVLISTCGFYSTKGNYDGLFKQFDILFQDKLTKIVCPEGELFRVPALNRRTNEYLSDAKKAGEEYSLRGNISSETLNKLSELLYPPDVFVEMANADWEINETNRENANKNGEHRDRSHSFMKQMAALYNPDFYTKDLVLEMDFTDLAKRYQLLLGEEKCVVLSEDFQSYTTRIETTFELWLEISEGKVSGSDALMKQLYKVDGDFDIMLKLDDFFSPKKTVKVTTVQQKSSNMLLLLLPFMAMWTVLPFDYVLGGIAGIIVSGLVSIMYFWFNPTPYERIGSFFVTIIGLVVLVTGGAPWQLSLPCFLSGLLWLSSAFLKVPITAYYSCNDYGGEKAYDNSLFIQTNRILTIVWSLAYLLWGVVKLLAIKLPNQWMIEIACLSVICLLGWFTTWFSKWYPARIARGR